MERALALRPDTETPPPTDRFSIFDRPLDFAPLVPEFILRSHHCFVSTDTRFGAAARLLSALWREDNAIPIGTYNDGASSTERRPKLGSRISARAARAGAAFMDGAVAQAALAELLFREEGSLWNEHRLWSNLLGSQGLCLNLFIPMAADLDLATRIWRALLPGFIDQVIRVRFEHSLGRAAERFLSDRSAFDVFSRSLPRTANPASSRSNRSISRTCSLARLPTATATPKRPAPPAFTRTPTARRSGGSASNSCVANTPWPS